MKKTQQFLAKLKLPSEDNHALEAQFQALQGRRAVSH